ncbi:MAG TPA: hypothetical protein VJP41_12900 [Gaiellaceae bacterium]|nr:hypothetical protein [Gaiellaceae bacterium]
MRTRNSLDRLAVAGRPLVSAADSLVDVAEEDRILEQILASPRATRRAMPRRRVAIVLVGAAVVAAGVAAIASGLLATSRSGGAGHGALSGAKLQLAGYHFRTPAGFTASSTACSSVHQAGPPTAEQNGFAAAGSADGGCVEAYFMISSSGSAIPDGAQPVDVGADQGYLVQQDGSETATLYVVLPGLKGGFDWQALVLFSKGLTTDQLVAVAQSGLPASP